MAVSRTVHRKNNNKERQVLFLHMHNATGDLSGRKTANGVAAGDHAQVVKVARTIHDARFTDVPADNQFYREINGLLPVRLTALPGRHLPSAEQHGPRNHGCVLLPYERPAAVHRAATPSFSDVPLNRPYYKEIEWMRRCSGITTGWPDGTYRPEWPGEP